MLAWFPSLSFLSVSLTEIPFSLNYCYVIFTKLFLAFIFSLRWTLLMRYISVCSFYASSFASRRYKPLSLWEGKAEYSRFKIFELLHSMLNCNTIMLQTLIITSFAIELTATLLAKIESPHICRLNHHF